MNSQSAFAQLFSIPHHVQLLLSLCFYLQRGGAGGDLRPEEQSYTVWRSMAGLCVCAPVDNKAPMDITNKGVSYYILYL